MTRYDLARQFRIMFGTSPYRYLLMRRLEFARELIHREHPPVEVAVDADLPVTLSVGSGHHPNGVRAHGR